MKIGLVCSYAFLNPQKGVEMRIHQTAALLEEVGQVYPVLVTSELVSARFEALKERYGSVVWVKPSLLASLSYLGKARRFLDLRCIEGRNRHVPPAEARPAIATLESCDAVWFHSLYVADALGVYRWPRSILDLDDLHSEKHRQIAQLATSSKLRLQARWQALLWRRWEKDALTRFDRVVVCSDDDRRTLNAGPRVAVMQNIIPSEGGAACSRRPIPDRIGFLGTLEYFANHDAVDWLIREILPLLVAVRPSLRLRIAGRIPSNLSLPFHPNVDVLGYVPDIDSEVSTWAASVAPIRIGGGTRLKIIESFRLRCPVVSTALGCHGLGITHDRELLIAGTARGFADGCLQVCAKPDLGRRMAELAFELWQRRYTAKSIRPIVAKLVTDVCGRVDRTLADGSPFIRHHGSDDP